MKFHDMLYGKRPKQIDLHFYMKPASGYCSISFQSYHFTQIWILFCFMQRIPIYRKLELLGSTGKMLLPQDRSVPYHQLQKALRAYLVRSDESA